MTREEEPLSLHHLRCAVAVVEQLNGAQLEDLVQEGRRLVDVHRHGGLAGWIPHSLVKVLQPGRRANKHSLFRSITESKQIGFL